MCDCESPEDFEEIWERISKNFQTRDGVIRHKRVAEELGKVKRLRRAKLKAGLGGAKKRWQSDSTADGNAIAKERKRYRKGK